MATSTTGYGPDKGRKGDTSYYLRNGEVIARPAHNTVTQKKRTAKVLASSSKMANLNMAWRLLKPYLQGCFELPKPTANDRTEFISHNLKRTEIHLTKEETEEQFAIADHFTVSHGTLPQPVQVRREGGWFLSDLQTGPMPLGPDTDIIDLVTALTQYNPGRVEPYDTIRFVRLRQLLDLDTRFPVAEPTFTELELNPLRRTTLRRMLEIQDRQEGFHLEQGCLAQPAGPTDLVAWIILRPQRHGRPLATTQTLFGDNPLIGQYSSPAHLEEAVQSYGPKKR